MHATSGKRSEWSQGCSLRVHAVHSAARQCYAHVVHRSHAYLSFHVLSVQHAVVKSHLAVPCLRLRHCMECCVHQLDLVLLYLGRGVVSCMP